ncbi:4'-phosphopantetheinyl transferase superfamily protein [Actinoplanes sp. NPDC051346]|uniref:4'-phosphopantetheinyl transferase family protein n=1 Tax=Actinoplanes sp. NPDC051346 TaxID=3155048 RepID=UPI00342CD8C9
MASAARGVVLWAAPVDRPELRDLLDERERHRYGGYREPADRARLVTGRALLRMTAGHLLSRPAAAVRVELDCRHCGREHGKPYVPGLAASFSVSHSADRVALLVCVAGEVGLDVQELRRVRHESLADRVLSGPEALRFATVPPRARRAAFGRYWCRKEALLKASGHGLALPMSSVTVSAHDAPARLLDWTRRPDNRPVALADLVGAGPGYAAAAAVIGADRVRVTEHQLSGALDPDGSRLILATLRELHAGAEDDRVCT